jgi:hypothetical protein
MFEALGNFLNSVASGAKGQIQNRGLDIESTWNNLKTDWNNAAVKGDTLATLGNYAKTIGNGLLGAAAVAALARLAAPGGGKVKKKNTADATNTMDAATQLANLQAMKGDNQ